MPKGSKVCLLLVASASFVSSVHAQECPSHLRDMSFFQTACFLKSGQRMWVLEPG